MHVTVAQQDRHSAAASRKHPAERSVLRSRAKRGEAGRALARQPPSGARISPRGVGTAVLRPRMRGPRNLDRALTNVGVAPRRLSEPSPADGCLRRKAAVSTCAPVCRPQRASRRHRPDDRFSGGSALLLGVLLLSTARARVSSRHRAPEYRRGRGVSFNRRASSTAAGFPARRSTVRPGVRSAGRARSPRGWRGSCVGRRSPVPRRG
jgi:hypothetical protein